MRRCRICQGPTDHHSGVCADEECQRLVWSKTLDKALEPPQAGLEKRMQALEDRLTELAKQVSMLNRRTIGQMVVGGPLPTAPMCGCPPNAACGNVACPRRSYLTCGG